MFNLTVKKIEFHEIVKVYIYDFGLLGIAIRQRQGHIYTKIF